MSSIILYEKVGRHGYSVQLTGEVVPANGVYDFRSVTVEPMSDVALFDRKNDIIVIHNGTKDQHLDIVDINKYIPNAADIDITLALRKADSADGQCTVREVATGKVHPIKARSDSSGGMGWLILIVIALVAIGVVLYFFRDRIPFMQKLLPRSNDAEL